MLLFINIDNAQENSSKSDFIKKFFVSKSSDINTSDGPLKVNTDSVIYFDYNENGYSVNRFEIGETKDINTYKKNGKAKVKTAKKGKDIILVEGKVRRISW